MNLISLLVTGGSGLVGHALQKIYPDAIYVSSKDYNLTSKQEVKRMYEQIQPTRVFHLAARVGGIIDNINHPVEFAYENILMDSYILHYAHRYKVKKLIGILSNCAYPDIVHQYPLIEEQLHEGPPQIANFSYAYAKRLLDIQLKAYRKQYNCNFFGIIPCNLYGPHDQFDEKKSHFLAALIKKIVHAQRTKDRTITLLGTGKPLRQFLYSEDLAMILKLLMEKYDGDGPLNIAPSENLSIAEIAEIAIQSIAASDISIVYDKSSQDGQYRKDISSEKLFEIIGKFQFTPLSEGIKRTYTWYAKIFEPTIAEEILK